MINKQISTASRTASDGLLAAVFVLSLGERLSRNLAEWAIHVGGLTQMIRQREAHGQVAVPEWFSDVVFFDFAHAATSIEGPQYNEMARELNKGGTGVFLGMLVSAGRDAARLSRAQASSESAMDEIDRRINVLYPTTQLLSSETQHDIACLARALFTFLSLEWPRELLSPAGSGVSFPFGFLAESLRLNLTAPRKFTDSSTSLVLWQYFVGSAAADMGSDTRTWFTDKLREYLAELQLCKWVDVVSVLSSSFRPANVLLQHFKLVWSETLVHADYYQAFPAAKAKSPGIKVYS